ncbi:hypothetical protein EYF80_055469 [Liparis tanakae]|uniref:Uncharacterized protein n=1 Tax=Liparis tanakae TaxID=230148 RepID=A0A4Z2EZI5_9TELE|nr:hypothetical protein EYF80_055469 [Liparis tanakae]
MSRVKAGLSTLLKGTSADGVCLPSRDRNSISSRSLRLPDLELQLPAQTRRRPLQAGEGSVSVNHDAAQWSQDLYWEPALNITGHSPTKSRAEVPKLRFTPFRVQEEVKKRNILYTEYVVTRWSSEI